MVEKAPEVINFPKEEENILAFWKEINAFHECLRQSKGKPKYSFYDGPPFATGLPHYGHILAGSIKDVVTRYAHQNGYHVDRRFGWDCHGLPVEFEIDKKLGIKGPEDVEKLGIANYNDECRKIVMRYSSQWEQIVTRLGRWIDFENDYKTLYPSFMESVWWVFSELWTKGLVYKGVKVMPYSTACNTPLSNFESGQNYKEVVDPAVVVTFPLKRDPNISLLAWTTTPWTLPSNLALCLNPDLEYVKVQEKASGKLFILMECRLEFVFKSNEDYKVLEKFKGTKLKGEQYIPLFNYFDHISSAFVILNDLYVTTESGTGVVHQAPYFGEDDYRVCLSENIITKDQEPVCPVDASGKFTKPVEDFIGQYVKDADKNIIKLLKEKGRLFSSSSVKHNYPFCWRSETPLIYKAVPSWFIRVESMSDALLKANETTYWVPDFVKEKRFGNWLREARDWAVSRNRYWGTPIPLWVSDDMEEIVCISSIAELEKLTGQKVTDLHRESVDPLTIPSKRNGFPPLKRIPEVFDCWFESGSMPYAQLHYPFENFKDFDERFPADFIAEGIDQTRGWFYTLLVISTALFNKAPFKNLIANGLVLAADGQKMSKRKQNYPDPSEVINKYGADALRLYLINSPVVRAESLRFKEEGVRDILKDVFLPWYNAYRFFIQNIERVLKEEGTLLTFDDEGTPSENLMDQWIISFTESLKKFVHAEMEAYRLYTVVPRLVQFIDNLTNWYVRMNRRRIRGEAGVSESSDSLRTLGSVLWSMIRLLAPYTPFLTELMFRNIRVLTQSREKSVHFVMMPQPKQNVVNLTIESAVEKMQCVIELGRIIRDRKTLPIKYPLKEVIIILQHSENIRELQPFHSYILEELNVKNVTFTTDRKSYGVKVHAEPEHRTLGLRLRGDFKKVAQAVKELEEVEIQKLLSEGELELLGHKINPEDLRIMFSFSGPTASELSKRFEAHSKNDVLVLLDVSPDESMMAEGFAREIINRVQKLRKKAKLVPTDSIMVHYEITPSDSELASVAVKYKSYIESALKAPFNLGLQTSQNLVIKETLELKGASMTLLIASEEEIHNNGSPYCRFLNVYLHGLEPRHCVRGDKGSILLENPVGCNTLSLSTLQQEVKKLFGLQGVNVSFKFQDGKELNEADCDNLNGSSLFIVPKGSSETLSSSGEPNIITKYLNVEFGNRKGVLLMENPVGDTLEETQEAMNVKLGRIFGIPPNKIEVRRDNNKLFVSEKA